VARSIGAFTRPSSFSQFFWWILNFLLVSCNVQIAGVAAICWAISKLRKRACFEGKIIQNPTELICFAVVFMKYWAGLNVQADRDALRQGADALQGVALGMMQPRSAARLAIGDSRRNGDTGEVDYNSEADDAQG
jgi:hypothetical protein